MSNIDVLKFRAKVRHYKEDEKEWVTGNVVGENISKIDKKSVWFGGAYVFGDTFCRFTGLKDAKGNDIYENDRLKPANYTDPVAMSDEELESREQQSYFSNPVVLWNPYRSAFQLVSEYVFQALPKMIDNGCYIQSDYEVDHVRKVRFQALTPELARQYVVYGNTIDDPDDSNYRVLPPKDADDFSDFYAGTGEDDGISGFVDDDESESDTGIEESALF